MNKLVAVMLYLLWTLSLLGIILITFRGFEYTDLNFIVAILVIFTVINTYMATKKK